MTLPTARDQPLRPSAVLAGSLVAHGLVLALLAFPRIEAFPDHSNDEDALTVTLERIDRTPELQSDAPPAGAPGPIRARTPRAVFRSPVAPLMVPGRLLSRSSTITCLRLIARYVTSGTPTPVLRPQHAAIWARTLLAVTILCFWTAIAFPTSAS